MAETFNGRNRIRKKFGNIREVARMPNLIEVQKSSYDDFLMVKEPEGGREDAGLQAVFKSVFTDREGNQFGTGVNFEGLHHLVLVEFDRARRDGQDVADLLRRVPLGQQSEDFPLSRGEAGDRVRLVVIRVVFARVNPVTNAISVRVVQCIALARVHTVADFVVVSVILGVILARVITIADAIIVSIVLSVALA